MKASELRPGQFFEFVDHRERYRAVDDMYLLNGASRLYYINKADIVSWCANDLEVTPLNVHGWDDEPLVESGVCHCGLPMDEHNILSGCTTPRDNPIPVSMVKPAPLQLRENAWYRRRDTLVVGPAKPSAGKIFPWIVGDSGYTDDGRYNEAIIESAMDLIAEVPPPVERQTADAPNHKCPLGLDETDQICSAGSCDKCRSYWTDKYAVALPEPPPVEPEPAMWAKAEFVPVEPEQFKAGDWVVCVDDNGCSGIHKGDVLLVSDIDEDDYLGFDLPRGKSFYLRCRFRRATPAEIEQHRKQGSCQGHATPQPDAEGWIPHKGNEMPVDETQLVEYVLGNNFKVIGKTVAGQLDWTSCNMSWCITHYRLVQPAPITHWVEVVTR